MPHDATHGPTGIATEQAQAPTPEQVRHLRATDGAGALHVVIAQSLTALGCLPALIDIGWLAYAGGQLVLATALVMWFVILHECGHTTLFRSRRLNIVVGHLAGLFVVIPFASWKSVHRLHHKWTGWQDLDPTTASLVPRELQPVERFAINFAWRTGFPLFSLLYRGRNFWHVPRLARLLPEKHARACLYNALTLAGVYILVVAALGPLGALRLAGPALFLSMVFMDPLMLSQHTHVPLHVSDGSARPIRARDQAVYTRSLEAPPWVSRWLLLGFDAHELHHVYPQVPGHLLRHIDLDTPNSFPWWTWLRRVKRMNGETFLFSNRDQTGADV